MLDDVLREARAGMDKAIKALRRDMAKVRTGRASVSLLDDVRVDYYGTPTPLSQVATLSVPEPRMITVQPWEKNLIPVLRRPADTLADSGLDGRTS
jgi:ribosome recycling factor